MADSCHPNFPPSLSITPSAGPFLDNAFLGRNGRSLFGVEAQREAISRYGIAGRVWEAAYALCVYIEHDALDFDPPFVDDHGAPLGVIELGSGTGVVAAHIASTMCRANRTGGFVIATDLPDVCPLLRHNLASNKDTNHADAVSVRPLAWGSLAHAASISAEFGYTRSQSGPARRRLTHIVCSDLVYFPELFGPLLRTLIDLTSPPLSGPPAKVVIAYKIRSLVKETPFWAAFGLWFAFQSALARSRGQTIESGGVPLDGELDGSPLWGQFGANEDSGGTFIFVAHRRPESIAWNVPETDAELMDGVGARGTTAGKEDDTFEAMLFMSMGTE